ncbi:hypothetical protein E2C01_024812 [Portunus trituberculatus]|uniref:Uncharacterized protein n=1 Tax=Portunus trituberculatus TaxID=210409 RepID=A0A5B7EDV4_PORTR|nr:hypothetical protein [Portunus trituberculatus]
MSMRKELQQLKQQLNSPSTNATNSNNNSHSNIKARLTTCVLSSWPPRVPSYNTGTCYETVDASESQRPSVPSARVAAGIGRGETEQMSVNSR